MVHLSAEGMGIFRKWQQDSLFRHCRLCADLASLEDTFCSASTPLDSVCAVQRSLYLGLNGSVREAKHTYAPHVSTLLVVC